ncbi:hypothetical protein RHOFW104T7_05120 [Rhodanobacter thiooxydans]|uniref:Secreted protein n=1 Tax=Rhodanobacter thiooxydans TaxID=416169 RepID=A0A154QMB2_9GAMM|nr:hypothetical protein [Rhodanobacter thiooxydans]EIL96982.1 hypothetical protein UUA_16358 [Rhodanobacter thiooxydans LCS2]KZC25132.1 hypothetical protein RHOFW104T7_05120 [Rhodanobacter thiooxydans]MCW0203244.1 hypothetical protein [Rhodanobacter thiooxydans]
MMRGRHCLALICAWSLAVAPAFAGKPPVGKNRGTPDKAVQARDKAQLAFQRDLVSVLAPSGDPSRLLGAALLARPLFNQPPSNSFHRLIERAAQAEGADTAVDWMRLADCDATADACPNEEALQHLLARAPDNAAVWLLKFGADARAKQQEAAREDLRQAAAAKRYDDYAGISLHALANAAGALPPPPDVLDPAHAGGAVGMQTVLVFGVAGTQPQPALQLVAKLCENAGEDASIKADCVALGKTLEWGSSPLARSLGLHLREVLADDPAQQQEAKDARRDLVWQVQSFAQLLARAQDDTALAQRLLALARHGGTEMSLQLAALRDNGIPVEAPAGWRPQSRK